MVSGPSFNRNNLRRLLQAKKNKKLAEEAQSIADEQAKEIIPASQEVIQQAKEPTPNTPLDNPGFFSRLGKTALDKLAAPGEVGAGIAFDLFDRDFTKRRSELQRETPEKGLFDYFGSARKAYQEKDLPLKYSLPLEIALDPLTYIPGFGALKAVTGIGKGAGKATTKIVKLQTAIDFDEAAKVAGTQIVNEGKKGVTGKVTDAGPLSWIFETAKGKGINLDYDNLTDRSLMKHMNLGSKVNSMASANSAKMSGIKNWNNYLDAENGLIKGTNTALDDRAIFGALEDVFDVSPYVKNRDIVDWDDIAKKISKDKDETWINLLSTNLDEVINKVVNKELIQGGKLAGNLTKDNIRSLGQMFKGFQELGEQAVKNGVDLKRITGVPYLSRRILSRNADEVVKVRTGKLGRKTSSQKTRKFKDQTVYQETLDAAVKAGNVKYMNDLNKVYELYSRDMYKAMNDNMLRRNLDKLALDDKFDNIVFDAGNVDKLNKLTNKIAKNKKVTVADIRKLRNLGYVNLAEVAEKGNVLKLIKNKQTMVEKLLQNGTDARVFEDVAGRALPPEFNGFFFTGKGAEKMASKYRALTGLKDDTDFVSMAAKNFDAVGSGLRVLKTGFDFGFSLLQGLPTLARAWYDPKALAQWGSSVKNGFKVMFRPEAVDNFMNEMRDTIVRTVDGDEISLLDEFVMSGGELGEYATDIYRGKSSVARGLEKIPGIGAGVSKAFEGALSPFERSFQFSSDVLRLKGYQYMRNTVYNNAPDGKQIDALKSLSAFLNKSTGALNPLAAGIPANQQAVERAFVFFSPRYTRASFSLIADAVSRGGIQGAEARKSLVGMAGFGIGTYVTAAAALGQEAELDPRSSKFMTVEINGNRIGLGSFWMSFARFVAKTSDMAFNDETLMEEMRTNPIFAYLRGRTSPATGLAYELFTGQDYLGREFESGLDYAKHIGTGMLPLAVEGAVLDDGYKGITERVAGFGPELLGMRVRPKSIWERRTSERDFLAVQEFNKKWKDLNTQQRKQLTTTSQSLQSFDAEAEKLSAQRGSEFQGKLENYYSEQDRIQAKYKKQIELGIAEMQLGEFQPRDFRNETVKSANAAKRNDYKNLNERLINDEKFSQVQDYFDEQSKAFSSEAQIEDIAYREYLSDVITADFDTPRGYDFKARERAEEDFKQKWGTEYFNYAVETLQTGAYLPDILNEYYKGREKYEFFWKTSEQAVIQNQDNPEIAQQLRDAYLAATDSERIGMEDRLEGLKEINNSISATKRELRKLNAGLDAFLFRWGYYDNLAHEDNEGEENFWNQVNAIDLEVYDTGPTFI